MSPVKASRIKGYNVPNKIVSMAINRNTLLARSAISRDTSLNVVTVRICQARIANSVNEIPMTNPKNARIKIPRVGSDAKEWTDVRIPERTRNVPNKLNEKLIMASSTVQFRSA